MTHEDDSLDDARNLRPFEAACRKRFEILYERRGAVASDAREAVHPETVAELRSLREAVRELRDDVRRHREGDQ